MEEEGTESEGVKARFAKLTAARNEAQANAAAAEKRANELQAKVAEYSGKMEGFAQLTQSNADLQAQLDKSAAKYGQLEGMVSAGIYDAEDRDLAAYYHGKSGSESSLVEWVGTLNAENAPKGLKGLFETPQTQQGAQTEQREPKTEQKDAPKPGLTDPNTGVKPTPKPQGEITGEMIGQMTPAEYKAYKATLAWGTRSR